MQKKTTECFLAPPSHQNLLGLKLVEYAGDPKYDNEENMRSVHGNARHIERHHLQTNKETLEKARKLAREKNIKSNEELFDHVYDGSDMNPATGND